MSKENIGSEGGLDEEAAETTLDLAAEARKSVADYFHEKGKDAPQVRFTTFYGQHGSAEDVLPVAVLVEKADIVFPEYLGWDRLPASTFIAEAKQDKESPQANFPEFYNALAEAIRKGHKPVGFIDIPTTDELFQRLEASRDSLFLEPRRELKAGRSFDEALDRWRGSVDEWATIQQKRERHMLARIGPELDRILAENPELARKDALSVLLTLGAAHTNIGRALRERGEDSESRLSESPFVFRFSLVQALRSQISTGRISEELYQRSFTDLLVLESVDEVPRNYETSPEETNRLAHAISSLMPIDDARALYDARAQGRDPTQTFISTLLAKRGLAWPRTREELQELLQHLS